MRLPCVLNKRGCYALNTLGEVSVSPGASPPVTQTDAAQFPYTMANVLNESTKGSAAMKRANAASNGSLSGTQTKDTMEIVKMLVVPVEAKDANTDAKAMNA
jgi:hypothetical protein